MDSRKSDRSSGDYSTINYNCVNYANKFIELVQKVTKDQYPNSLTYLKSWLKPRFIAFQFPGVGTIKKKWPDYLEHPNIVKFHRYWTDQGTTDEKTGITSKPRVISGIFSTVAVQKILQMKTEKSPMSCL
jgi:hypothetical protein